VRTVGSRIDRSEPKDGRDDWWKPDPAVWISELRASQQRQAELVARITPEELRRPSFDREWTVAQLLSHMGSGAEITRDRLASALAGGGSFEPADAEKVWDRWNAMAPEQQAAEMVESDGALVDAFEGLDERTRRELRIPFFGEIVHDVARAAAMRLNEHALPIAVPTWSSPPRRSSASPTAASTRSTPPPASGSSPRSPSTTSAPPSLATERWRFVAQAATNGAKVPASTSMRSEGIVTVR
jgi:hypothetical protein